MRSLADIRSTVEAASPGPWEAGRTWCRAGLCYQDGKRVADKDVPTATECAYCYMGPPVFTDPAMDINGRIMPGHVHHDPSPHDVEYSISDSAGGLVLQGSDEYGSNLGEADAAFMRHARQDVPDLVAEVERLTAELAEARAGEPEPFADARGIVWRWRSGYMSDDGDGPCTRETATEIYGAMEA